MNQRTASFSPTATRCVRHACAILLGTVLASACAPDLESPTYGETTTGGLAGPTTGSTNTATTAATGTTGSTTASAGSTTSATGAGGATSSTGTVTGTSNTSSTGTGGGTSDGGNTDGNTDGGEFNCNDVGDSCCNGVFCFGGLDCEDGLCVEEEDDGDGGAAGAAGAGSQ